MTLLSKRLAQNITQLDIPLGIMPVFPPLFPISQGFHMKHFPPAVIPAVRTRFVGWNQFLAVGASRERNGFEREMARTLPF